MSGLSTCFLLVSLALVVSAAGGRSKHLVSLGEDNWKEMLTGEWMVEFHAPWCPACKDLQKTWNSFADWSKDLSITVAEVDVTRHPGLSGRFLVTALPTIYHVKDGVFRHYAGVRDKEEFMKFIEDRKWTVVEPMSSWKHPDSPQMGIVAIFFRLSMKVRDLHNYLIEVKGLPPWGSYAIFGTATLVLGCILGFFIVMLIDFVFPATAGAVKVPEKKDKKKKKADKSEKKNAASGDDARDSQDEAAAGSQANSQSEADSADEGKEVRQRKGANDEKKKASGDKTSDGKKKK